MLGFQLIRPILIGLAISLCSSVVLAADTVPVTVQQPGTQPGDIGGLESPNKCDNCHGGYNSAVEPAHNWRGSMMAHAGRDPIFWATVAVAEQDFNGAGDLCLRCHSTTGWLGGRSTPTDGSGLAASDSDGVDCDFCHKLTDPDGSEHVGVMNTPFVANDGTEGFYGSGIASVWGGNDKLGPYADAEPKHQFMVSKFHRSVDFCGTCHDVSNPVVGNLAHNAGTQSDDAGVVRDQAGDGSVEGKAAFNNPPYKYGTVERTFSEFKSGRISQTLVSEYSTLPADLQGGALQAIYEAATANGGNGDYDDGTPRYYSCQSCHVRPVPGKGANKRGIPNRTDMPLHDMTGGNYWMPEVIKYLDQRGKLRLGGNMSPALIDAMLDGALRAREQLDLAASMEVNGTTLKIINHTGHKLISGYPEGRRMWLNIKWYDNEGNALPGEIGAYGPIAVTNPVDGSSLQVNSIVDIEDGFIYEAHYGMTREWALQLIAHGVSENLALSYDRLTGTTDDTLADLAAEEEGETEETFHFVLNNTIIKDNRIPPYGMDFNEAQKRNALPVPVNQYGGGTSGSTYKYWDQIDLGSVAPSGAVAATIDLLYQPTSWEYIQFLVLANKGSDPAQGGNAFLGEEGENLFDAWLNTGMAEPHVMASTNWGAPPAGCDAPVPALASATAGNKEVALAWDDPEPITTPIDSYKLYYDQSGKAQHVADILWGGNGYLDTNLTNGQTYCYKLTTSVSNTEGACESAFSNKLCATPASVGQAVIGVDPAMTTGTWVRDGKGKNATETFVVTSEFAAGDRVVIQGAVSSNEARLPGAAVEVTINQGGAAITTLSSGSTDSQGRFEVSWQTQRPNRKGNGGTPTGSYTAHISGIFLNGYQWDEKPASAGIIIR
jgi:hypothetical protein